MLWCRFWDLKCQFCTLKCRLAPKRKNRIKKKEIKISTKSGCRKRRSAKGVLGKIQRGAHKRGLKPQIFRENRGEILPGKSGLFGANRDHFRAGRGLFGADRDQFLRTLQPRGKSRNCPERALFGPIGAFWAKPPFAKPPFGFPRKRSSITFLRFRDSFGVPFSDASVTFFVTFLPNPKDPSVLKIVRRVNFGMGSKFGTDVAKRYGEGSEVLVFLGKRGRKTVRILKNYGSGKIVRIRAPYYF